MAKREIIDCIGRNTGASVARYIWRSKPTQDPSTGLAVRCLVAQDDKGRFWAGTRIGRGSTNPARHEYWLGPCATKQEAMQFSREQTREFLFACASIASDAITPKKPGEKLVEVKMDDGWSVAINAPGKLAPAERRAMATLDGLGKGTQTKSTTPKRSMARDWPSR